MVSIKLIIPFEELVDKLNSWLKQKAPECALVLLSGDINNCPKPIFKKLVVGVSFNTVNAITKLNDVPSNPKNIPLLGCLSYELKNEFEALESTGKRLSEIDSCFFFQPDFYFEVDIENQITTNNSQLFNEIIGIAPLKYDYSFDAKIEFKRDVEDVEYLDNIAYIKNQIIEGNVYELNYCRNFSSNIKIDPYKYFALTSKQNPTPYSFFFKLHSEYMISSSMERFLSKSGTVLTSQPIKGTLRNTRTNEALEKENLYNSEKDRAENLMIVDLVRNDMSKCSEIGSVKVDELFGIYSYPSVHQMISTINSQLLSDVSFQDIVKSLFPMGSMTGAPKLSAMKIIDQLETFQRGAFSGSFGYIQPNGDFDFNVVIRTLFYNSKSNSINIPVGSAITIDSDPNQELNECNDKVNLLFELINKCSSN
jgi:para-aminobenzoate synthetase component 1